MEFELLKEIWNEEADKPVRFLKIEGGIAGKLPASHRRVVSTMKRNLLVELIIVLVCVSGIAIFYFTAFNGRLQEVSWVYIAMAAVFGWYFYKKNKLLKQMECVVCQVKSNLEQQLTALEKYVRLYLVTGALMVPLVLLFFYMLVYYKHIVLLPSLYEYSRHINFTLLYIIFAVTFTIGLYFLNRWYINRLYGRHIGRLRNMLNEMSETP
jgi:hypothetical protein